MAAQAAVEADEEQGSTSSDLIRAGSAPATTSLLESQGSTVVFLDSRRYSSALAETVRRPDVSRVWRRTSLAGGTPRALSDEAAAAEQALRDKWARYKAAQAAPL